MKKLMFVATFTLLVFTGLEKSYSQKLTGEDDRIIITVDSIERTESFPERLKEIDFSTGKPAQYRPPSEGNDFVVFSITEVKKRDLKINPMEIVINNTYVIDDKSETHKISQLNFQIPINITYPSKTSGSLFLEMPKNATPVQLKYSYQYREDPPESQEIKIGQIDITL
jgi:hypothetical protein